MFLGASVGETHADTNELTHVCMGKFEGIVVPIVLHKRQRLVENDSGISYSNFNVTTCKGNVNVRSILYTRCGTLIKYS